MKFIVSKNNKDKKKIKVFIIFSIKILTTLNILFCRCQFSDAIDQKLDPNSYLENNDSYTFYSTLDQGKYLLKTGHTGTNVMDLQVVLIKPY